MRAVLCLYLSTIIACDSEGGKSDKPIDRSVETGPVTTPTLPDPGTTDTGTPVTPPSGDDLDEDGHASLESGGDDCDDTNPAINPDAVELDDDAVDNDCDTEIDECLEDFSRVSGIVTVPVGATIEWVSFQLSFEAGEDIVVDNDLFVDTPPDITTTNVDNVATFAYDRCIADTITGLVNAEFHTGDDVDWLCQQSTVSGLQFFKDDLDVTDTITADVWNPDGACDAAF